ncbi:hypothetical protein SLEP1_g34886 [Rubroshorea leprosula]|uniref:Uncharacterized protein n=1 Tax=Rubroshorea leprosula TaxID=152421 RepID=A0AAV5KLG2_9ROSI|nr:hypothetical protein SLEP1_g34886 [Rubroshorea leprosula]
MVVLIVTPLVGEVTNASTCRHVVRPDAWEARGSDELDD